MLLKSVTIENFGPFQGKQTLNLAPSHSSNPGRPVVLIGGRNGSGKSSIMEAIRLCIHGRWALGRLRSTEYHDYLRERVHVGPNWEYDPRSSVHIEMETVEDGCRHSYEVSRTWLGARVVSEELQIRRDGELLSDLFADQHQSFLDEIIPLGLAELFFFDGERIRHLAEERNGDRVTSDCIRGLLGLNLTSRLHADMTILLRSNQDSTSTERIQLELETMSVHLSECQGQIDSLESDRQDIANQMAELERAILAQEQRIASEGGYFAEEREALLQEKVLWGTVLQTNETALRELASDSLPICIVPELCEDVRRRVQEETEARNSHTVAALLRSRVETQYRALQSTEFWRETLSLELTPSEIKRIAKAVSTLVRGTNLEKHEPSALAHDLSERDTFNLLASIETALTDLPQESSSIVAKAQEAQQNLLSIERKLRRVPREVVIKSLAEELRLLHLRLRKAQREDNIIEDKLRKAIFRRGEIERGIKRHSEQLEELKHKDRMIALAAKVRNTVRTYEQKLTAARVDHLSESVSRSFNELAHKDSLCCSIRFDPDTLSPTLYDSNGTEISGKALSAGEKQILAVAILWGLGQASGRQLPVVIDTPLARLDNEHRYRMLTRYFPRAGHQVVLLSTDSEIDSRGLGILRPHIAKELHLRFDPEHGRTSIRDGYLPLQEEVNER